MTTRSAMLFAPLPPPVGGITSITAMLRREFADNPDILFVQPVPKTTTWKRVFRPVISVARLLRGTLQVRRSGRVVFFCSSRASFWDKCVWAALVLLLGRTAVMVMVAGDFPETFARSPHVARAFAQWLFRRRRLIVAAQSASWATTYRSLFPHTAVTQVGATVDPEFFQAHDAAGAEEHPLTVLFVGWIIEDKGIPDLLDGVASIASSLKGRARLRLVGPMFGRDVFWQTEIDRRGITALVNLAGAVTSRAGILREYQRADAFVFPSHFEGLPVALLEAAAAGLPCVATDVGGVVDILDGGRAGLIVPSHSPSALAAALETLVSDIALRRRLGAAACRHSRRAFSLEACVRSYERVLGVR
jgi:glycosyltransferase involved in cell wall biosynthesis